MGAKEEERIEELERRTRQIERSLATSETPVFAVAMWAALIIYISVLSDSPLGQGVEGGERFWGGAVSAVVGILILGGALTFTQFALKSMVEVSVVLTGLGNAIYCFWAYSSFSMLKVWVASETSIEIADADFVAAVVAVLLIFLCNVFIFMTLYPMAKAAGSNALDV